MWERAGRTAVAVFAAGLLCLATAATASADGVQQDPADAEASLEELAATATEAVVLIEVTTDEESARQGSGFLIDPDGLILTNFHVVRDAKTATVRLASGDVYDRVTILATDERRDIAALRIPGFALPSLPMGNSDSVRIGAPAIAIGSPLGLENTVSTGIVSGRRQEPEGFQRLQLTAPASPGSSGGPVLAMDGTVIGIAAAQIRSGQNLNFAVPINYARGLLSQMDGEPVAILTGSVRNAPRTSTDLASPGGRVNGRLDFDLSGFTDHRIDFVERGLGGETTRTRITYRRIDDITGGEARIERYVESETTLERGGPGPPLLTRRERSRSIVSASTLRPVSALGRADWLVDGEWRHTEHDLTFVDGRVRGTIQDSSGVVSQVDRDLPPGILLRQLRDLAFSAVVASERVGRSLELVAYDAASGRINNDRYDVRREGELDVAGRTYDVLIVDLASGLSNERLYFMTDSPGVVLRRESDSGVEEMVALVRGDGEGPDAP